MHQIGDFIIDDNEVVKITGIHQKNNQLDTDKHGLITPCMSNITINKEVIDACGFTLNPTSGLHVVTLNSGKLVSCKLSPSGAIKDLAICCPFQKHVGDIGVLSTLQDIIRNLTGEDLPIDVQKLQDSQKF